MVLYGLTAAPFARLLRLTGAGEGVVVVVGGNAYVREIALTLKSAGQRVRLWTGRSDEQAAAREAGLVAGHAYLVQEYAGDRILFGEAFMFSELKCRFDAGKRLVEMARAGDGVTPLFFLRDGRLTVVTAGVVAFAAGIAGMLAVEMRASSAVGVGISITTITAAA